MRAYTLTHLTDAVLLRDLAALVAQDRTTTAAVLAHIAEVDARKLYLPAGYPSMHAYCIDELRFSEQAALKRIHAARAARRFPAIFAAVAEGRLNLSAVELLAPCLTPENAAELLAAAELRSKSEIEQLLAARFPRPEVPTRLQAHAPTPAEFRQLSPGRVGTDTADRAGVPPSALAPGQVEALSPERAGALPVQLAPGQAVASAPRTRLAPLAPERFALQLTISQGTHDKLRYAQALLSHSVPPGISHRCSIGPSMP